MTQNTSHAVMAQPRGGISDVGVGGGSTALLPRGPFGVVLADPPWRFKTYSEKGRGRAPDGRVARGMPRVYDTMTIAEIWELPVTDVVADDACLFLWVSWPMLEDALLVMAWWGFTFKTCAFNWLKMTKDGSRPVMGCGYWTRANSEVCLLGTRGKPKRKHADVRQAILEPRREHSRKPLCVYDRIERLVDGPYLELFCRQRRPGWHAWGNETTKFGRKP